MAVIKVNESGASTSVEVCLALMLKGFHLMSKNVKQLPSTTNMSIKVFHFLDAPQPLVDWLSVSIVAPATTLAWLS